MRHAGLGGYRAGTRGSPRKLRLEVRLQADQRLRVQVQLHLELSEAYALLEVELLVILLAGCSLLARRLGSLSALGLRHLGLPIPQGLVLLHDLLPLHGLSLLALIVSFLWASFAWLGCFGPAHLVDGGMARRPDQRTRYPLR